MNRFSPLPIWQIVSVETMVLLVFFVCFNKQIQDYLCFTVFFSPTTCNMPLYYCKAIFEFQIFLLNTHFLYIIIQNMYQYRWKNA